MKEQLTTKVVRITREKISQKEIDDINARHERIMQAAIEVAREIIAIGEKLFAIKGRLQHGKWVLWVERNLKFNIRTAQRYMKAYEKRHALFDSDATEFMARIWGHESAELEDSKDDTEGKNDAASHSKGEKNDASGDGNALEDDGSEERPVGVSAEQWTGFLLIRGLNQALDEYIQQPISDKEKLVALIAVYDALLVKIDGLAKKSGKTLEQVLTAPASPKKETAQARLPET